MFNEKNLSLVRENLKRCNLDGYIVFTSDPHGSEYVASHFFHERSVLCPFTGDAGTILITQNFAYLWTDGRFFIQASRELKNSEFILMKMGQKDVPTIQEFIKKNKIKEVGFSFLMTSNNFYESMKKVCHTTDISFASIFKDRPALPTEKLFKLDKSLTGEDFASKIKRIRKVMKEKGAKAHLVSTLEDIAWITNLRGHDVTCTPVFYSYLYIDMKSVTLFIDKKKVEGLDISPIIVKDYNEIDAFLLERSKVKTLVSLNHLNAHIVSLLKKKIDGINPSVMFKSIKNKTEIANIKKVHELDGVAMVKIMKYIDNKQNKCDFTELEIENELEKYRRENERCYDLSFGTICAYNANGACMHYSTPKDNKLSTVVKGNGLLLIDSGGQYFGGTTDITRTFAIGEISQIMKTHFTMTLKSLISLSTSVFLYGCSGVTIDIKAREIMWKNGLDYKCGTGHGVGYMLSVHEGPQGFRYKIVPEREDSSRLEIGNITTIEPGVYIEDGYGIRIENELLTIKDKIVDGDLFLKFETVTYCPIDKKCIDKSLLTLEEINWINEYHKLVYKKLSPYFIGEELDYLREITKKI